MESLESFKNLPVFVNHQERLEYDILVNNRWDLLPLLISPHPDICMQAIMVDPINIKHIKVPSEKMILAGVKQTALVLEWINKKYQSEKVCLEAIKYHKYALKYIAPENQTEKVCLEAIRKGGDEFQYIAPENQTKILGN